MFHHWTLKKRLTLTFVAILILAGGLIGVALVNIGKLRDTVNWNTHTRKVLTEADSMLLNMVNIETGLRGFVAGGDEKFLDPFKSGEQAFALAFKAAKSLTSDNPAQQGRLDQAMANHQQFMAVANALVNLRRDVTGGKVTQDELLREFSAGKDKVAMDAFRASMDLSSGDSAMPASVVISRPATEAASCSAMRTPLVGSMPPALTRSS